MPVASEPAVGSVIARAPSPASAMRGRRRAFVFFIAEIDQWLHAVENFVA